MLLKLFFIIISYSCALHAYTLVPTYKSQDDKVAITVIDFYNWFKIHKTTPSGDEGFYDDVFVTYLKKNEKNNSQVKLSYGEVISIFRDLNEKYSLEFKVLKELQKTHCVLVREGTSSPLYLMLKPRNINEVFALLNEAIDNMYINFLLINYHTYYLHGFTKIIQNDEILTRIHLEADLNGYPKKPFFPIGLSDGADIYIKENLSIAEFAEVLIHEITHFIKYLVTDNTFTENVDSIVRNTIITTYNKIRLAAGKEAVSVRLWPEPINYSFEKKILREESLAFYNEFKFVLELTKKYKNLIGCFLLTFPYSQRNIAQTYELQTLVAKPIYVYQHKLDEHNPRIDEVESIFIKYGLIEK